MPFRNLRFIMGMVVLMTAMKGDRERRRRLRNVARVLVAQR
jgi:hypothetical protein